MEVIVPRFSPDFSFGDKPSQMSAPSSPKPFGRPIDYLYHHASAPTSPTRASAIYHLFNSTANASPEPLDLDGEPDDVEEFNFAFDFSGGQLEMGSYNSPTLASADDLFHHGQIRPMNPLPPSHGRRSERDGGTTSAWSKTSTSSSRINGSTEGQSSSTNRRRTRSLSLLRGDEILHKTPVSSPSPSIITTKDGGSKRWSLKDLFLFRSASEGRATGIGSKDVLRKYYTIKSSSPSIWRAGDEEDQRINNGSTEEMKKKKTTPLLRHGLFGYLRFNPAVHSITRGHNGNPLSR